MFPQPHLDEMTQIITWTLPNGIVTAFNHKSGRAAVWEQILGIWCFRLSSMSEPTSNFGCAKTAGEAKAWCTRAVCGIN